MKLTNLTRHIEIGANSYCLEVSGKKIVLDSGLHPRNYGEQAMPDWSTLEDDAADAIVLTHAHQDHLGSLPVLMRRHPRAPVFMTEPTRHIASIMLHNSVNVMLSQREELGLQNYPLFTHREIDKGVARWQPCPLHQPFTLTGERDSSARGGVTLEFYDAGHILGAAGVLIRDGDRKIFYTGDVNFEDQTLCPGAHFPSESPDVLIVETTRGDSPLAEGYTRKGEALRLVDAIEAAFGRGGSVLMPIFALGKTQEMLAMFYEFRRQGRLADVPIHIGGLSTKLTEVYDRLARSATRLLPDLQILDTVAPYVISGRQTAEPILMEGHLYSLSSGMMTEKTLSNSYARRVLSDPKQTLIFVGYADPISPAGKIRRAQPGDSVTLDADFPPQELRCHIETFNFSGHASRESLRAWIGKAAPKKIVLVHGDLSAVEWFRKTLSQDLPGSEIVVPEPGVPLEI